jgi:hypothetical protein
MKWLVVIFLVLALICDIVVIVQSIKQGTNHADR